ncbi:MAG: ABC transporter ATP-binding protein [Phycisphaerales bacterium]|nr:ABC transporter ATP-binding protein [Phycisphaerales bacterium]
MSSELQTNAPPTVAEPPHAAPADARAVVIEARDVSKSYRIYSKPSDRLRQALAWGRKQYYREFWALQGVSLEVRAGEMVGIIGRNGSGKSTLLQIIAGTLAPTSGEIRVPPRIAALLELGSGFHPEATGRENVYMNGVVLGLSDEEIRAKYADIVGFADIGEFIDQPVKTYSSGMVVRLAFAVAAHVDAQVLVVDEALAVGDAPFQAKCFRRLDKLREAGATILLATHDNQTVSTLCERALMLDRGKQILWGPGREVAREYYRFTQEATRAAVLAETPAEAPGAPSATDGGGELEEPSRSAGHHTGDGRCRVVGFQVFDHLGRANRTLVARERVRVELRVRFDAAMENPQVFFALRDVQSRIVLGAHTLYENVVIGPVAAGETIHATLCATLNLNVGKYLLLFGVSDHEAFHSWKDSDVHWDYCEIEVIADQRAWGIVNVPAEISVRRVGAHEG